MARDVTTRAVATMKRRNSPNAPSSSHTTVTWAIHTRAATTRAADPRQDGTRTRRRRGADQAGGAIMAANSTTPSRYEGTTDLTPSADGRRGLPTGSTTTAAIPCGSCWQSPVGRKAGGEVRNGPAVPVEQQPGQGLGVECPGHAPPPPDERSSQRRVAGEPGHCGHNGLRRAGRHEQAVGSVPEVLARAARAGGDDGRVAC